MADPGDPLEFQSSWETMEGKHGHLDFHTGLRY
jgi:hypothetical protein